jgi:hypothetical protein
MVSAKQCGGPACCCDLQNMLLMLQEKQRRNEVNIRSVGGRWEPVTIAALHDGYRQISVDGYRQIGVGVLQQLQQLQRKCHKVRRRFVFFRIFRNSFLAKLEFKYLRFQNSSLEF